MESKALRFTLYQYFLILLLSLGMSTETNKSFSSWTWDKNGYVLFCLCMGRFGNQAEHLLGGMAFTKALNRTLIIPPWITYKTIPFNEWFKLETMQKFGKVILAADFMKQLAAEHWPKEQRKGYCWLPTEDVPKCNMKTGFPFKVFWNDLNIDFVEEIIHQLDYDIEDPFVVKQWKERFPPEEHPVLAMRGSPARYPMKPLHRSLQQFLEWSPWIQHTANDYISSKLKEEKFVGIHLRNEHAWRRYCVHAEGRSSFMASPQCISSGKYGMVTRELCDPPKELILATTVKIIQEIDAKHLFIATDFDPMLEDFKATLQQHHISIHHLNPERPQIDLAILGLADYFIGNCVSSFTAFVKRERDLSERPSAFWAFPNDYV